MKNKIITLVASLVLIVSACQEQKKSNATESNLKDIAYDAFIYAYPMMEQVKTVNGMQQFLGMEINKSSMNPKLFGKYMMTRSSRYSSYPLIPRSR